MCSMHVSGVHFAYCRMARALLSITPALTTAEGQCVVLQLRSTKQHQEDFTDLSFDSYLELEP